MSILYTFNPADNSLISATLPVSLALDKYSDPNTHNPIDNIPTITTASMISTRVNPPEDPPQSENGEEDNGDDNGEAVNHLEGEG